MSVENGKVCYTCRHCLKGKMKKHYIHIVTAN